MKFVRSRIGTTHRREFRIVLGLREGFGPESITHSFEEAAEAIRQWNEQQGKAGNPCLPGCIVPALYNWVHGTRSNAQSGLEPAIVFEDSLSNSALPDLPTSEAEELIQTLAVHLARTLNQQYVEFSYQGRKWSCRQK
ncbi:MAG TPA: hypothetical protein VFZ48_04185 [Candidatus Saccharimonadales bacterium]